MDAKSKFYRRLLDHAVVGAKIRRRHMAEELDKTLENRGKEYGDFRNQAEVVQGMKNVMRANPGWERMTPYQQEAADMIVHKLARIVNGNPFNVDSWHDIVGYAEITKVRVEQDIKKDEEALAPFRVKTSLNLDDLKSMGPGNVFMTNGKDRTQIIKIGDMVTHKHFPSEAEFEVLAFHKGHMWVKCTSHTYASHLDPFTTEIGNVQKKT